MKRRQYGYAPSDIDYIAADVSRVPHMLYMPIVIPEEPAAGLSSIDRRDMTALAPIVKAALDAEDPWADKWEYVYLTVKHGITYPGNSLTRPGWHVDGFGTSDVNYVWAKGDQPRNQGTEYAVGAFEDIPDDHLDALDAFTRQATRSGMTHSTVGNQCLVRMDASVVHRPPATPTWGWRQFVKVSFSHHRYCLEGNTRNPRLDYDWPVIARNDYRNEPTRQETP